MMCVRSLWIVVASIVVGAGAGLALTPHPRDEWAQFSTEPPSRNRQSDAGLGTDAQSAFPWLKLASEASA